MTTTVEEKRETFTPGPWKIKNGKNYYHIHGGQEVALVENWMNETPRANARLSTAAPEMYELCKLFENCMERIDGAEYDASYELAKVRAVLAKVEGGME